jgi:nicotinate-nucleotide adenylyltransferase
MLKLALGHEPRYTLDDFELRSNEPTYTVHTLSRLRLELGRSVPLVFLIGADQLLALDRWKEWKTLFELAHFGVARRPGYPLRASSMPSGGGEFEKRRAAPRSLRSNLGLIAVRHDAARDSLLDLRGARCRPHPAWYLGPS